MHQGVDADSLMPSLEHIPFLFIVRDRMGGGVKLQVCSLRTERSPFGVSRNSYAVDECFSLCPVTHA